ncbi:hypothetical protein X975_16136, partial [Stegodyphus mimosarum]
MAAEESGGSFSSSRNRCPDRLAAALVSFDLTSS